MYAQFKPSKSLSTSKKLLRPKTKQPTKENTKTFPKQHIAENLEGYIKQDPQRMPKGNKKQSGRKQNIYYTSTCVQTDEQCRIKSMKSVSKRKEFISKKSPINNAQMMSSESSISSILLRKKHFIDRSNENSKQNNQINPQKSSLVVQRSISPKTGRQQNIKHLSAKTSIKQIQQIRSSHQIIPQTPKPLKTPSKQSTKDSTYRIVIKNMLSQLKSTREQNSQLKQQLIRIKSQEYYYLNRQKVKQMVMELQKQKELRKQVQQQNVQVKEQNLKLKQENTLYKKENYRVKRINARMKEQIDEVKEENVILRRRVNLNQDQRHSCSDSDQDLGYDSDQVLFMF